MNLYVYARQREIREQISDGEGSLDTSSIIRALTLAWLQINYILRWCSKLRKQNRPLRPEGFHSVSCLERPSTHPQSPKSTCTKNKVTFQSKEQDLSRKDRYLPQHLKCHKTEWTQHWCMCLECPPY
jgi:hypothetical protein